MAFNIDSELNTTLLGPVDGKVFLNRGYCNGESAAGACIPSSVRNSEALEFSPSSSS